MSEPAPGLVVAALDEPFVDAVLRLLQLLDDPGARQVLAPSRLRELYFALLRSEALERNRQGQQPVPGTPETRVQRMRNAKDNGAETPNRGERREDGNMHALLRPGPQTPLAPRERANDERRRGKGRKRRCPRL